MIVNFTQHAQQRLSQRLNLRVIPRNLDIDGSFTLTRVYLHTNGRMVESWACVLPNIKCVLIIDRDTKRVLTVMTEGVVVDTIYSNL